MSKITVRTSPLNSARTINRLQAEGIILNNIVREHDFLSFVIESKDGPKCKSVLQKLYLSFDHTEQKNYFNQLFNLSRIGLVLGIVLSIGLYFFLSIFITNIEISGIGENKKKEVMQYLQKSSICVGTNKSNIDLETLDRNLLKDFDFSITESKIVGTTLSIKLKEELNPPIIYDENSKPIISKEDALITRIVTISGTKMVDVGKSVKKGDTLIDAKKIIENVEVSEKAIGEVYGKVWRKKDVFIPDKVQDLVETGKVETYHSICIGSYIGKVDKPTFDCYTYTQTSTRIGDFLPFYQIETTYFEQKKVERSLSDLEINDIVVKAKKELLLGEENAVQTILDSRVVTRKVDGGTVFSVIIEIEKRIDI